MVAHLFVYATFILTALAATNTFHSPTAKPFLSTDFFVGWPVNATTSNGLVAITPNAAGTITGSFDGYVVENTTASVERFLDSESGLYSAYTNELLFANDDGDSLLVKMTGTAAYANKGLHDFAHVSFETVIPRLNWTNYAMFVGEWVASQQSGTGNAKFEIFEIRSGGRVDGEPIAALEGTEP